MNLKSIYKTAEGLSILICFSAIIFTGYIVYAWIGISLYTVINLMGESVFVSKLRELKNIVINRFNKLLP